MSNSAESTDQTRAIALLNSMRGRYLISEALHLAIMELKQQPAELQEKSNIEDMQQLLTVLPQYPATVR